MYVSVMVAVAAGARPDRDVLATADGDDVDGGRRAVIGLLDRAGGVARDVGPYVCETLGPGVPAAMTKGGDRVVLPQTTSIVICPCCPAADPAMAFVTVSEPGV